jgi:tetratricopeptide (TPR) repeat protein
MKSVSSFGPPASAPRILQHPGFAGSLSRGRSVQFLHPRHLRDEQVERATALVERSIELAEETGNVTTHGWALYLRGRILAVGGDDEAALAALEEARERFTHGSVLWGLARVLNELAALARRRGDRRTAERHYREAIRLLAPTEDRGTLCESQRGLAELLVEMGRIDDAEQLALAACETVSHYDVISRVTTGIALGTVRAAQGRDAEAEAALRSAVELAEPTGLHYLCASAGGELERFLLSRGRAPTESVSAE